MALEFCWIAAFWVLVMSTTFFVRLEILSALVLISALFWAIFPALVWISALALSMPFCAMSFTLTMALEFCWIAAFWVLVISTTFFVRLEMLVVLALIFCSSAPIALSKAVKFVPTVLSALTRFA